MDNEKLSLPQYDIPEDIQNAITITTLDRLYNWGRRSSVWPLMFGLACCAIEMIVAQTARYDMARFGMEVMRPTPRQADLMLVSGTVTKKMVPAVIRLYNQMPEPKYVWQWVHVHQAVVPSRKDITSWQGLINSCP